MMTKKEVVELLQSMVPFVVGELMKEKPEPPRYDHVVVVYPFDSTSFKLAPPSDDSRWRLSDVKIYEDRAVTMWVREVPAPEATLPEPDYGHDFSTSHLCASCGLSVLDVNETRAPCAGRPAAKPSPAAPEKPGEVRIEPIL